MSPKAGSHLRWGHRCRRSGTGGKVGFAPNPACLQRGPLASLQLLTKTARAVSDRHHGALPQLSVWASPHLRGQCPGPRASSPFRAQPSRGRELFSSRPAHALGLAVPRVPPRLCFLGPQTCTHHAVSLRLPVYDAKTPRDEGVSEVLASLLLRLPGPGAPSSVLPCPHHVACLGPAGGCAGPRMT